MYQKLLSRVALARKHMTEDNSIFNPTMKHRKQPLNTDETGQRTEHLHQN